MGIRKVISTDDNIYIFEDLITGGDLFSRLGEKDTFSEVEAMPIVWQLLKALDYMHRHGVVHRDLKVSSQSALSERLNSNVLTIRFPIAR